MSKSLKIVTVSAPGKLMLTGSYAVVHGRPCVVTAVDSRLWVTIERNGTDQFHLTAPDLGLSTYTKTLGELGSKDLPNAVRFIETLYKQFLETYPQDHGISVTTKNEFSSSLGFGSSSAVTAAFAKALVVLYGVEMSNQELFEMCYQTVLKVQGVGSGFDLAAAIWGGTIKYVTPAKVIEPVQVAESELSRHILVAYSGEKADTPTLVRMVNARLETEPETIQHLFDEIGNTTDNAVLALNQKNWSQLGTALNQHQDLTRRLGVSTPRLETMIQAAASSGSYGASLSGAGGGDCIVVAVDEESTPKVSKALSEVAEVVKVKLHAEGVRVESSALGEE